MTSVDAIASEYVERVAALDPVLATIAGIGGHDDQMPDLSADGFAERARLDRSTLAALESARVAGAHEQVARAAMREHLGSALECYDAGDTTSQLNVIACWVQSVPDGMDSPGSSCGHTPAWRRSGSASACIASWAGRARHRPISSAAGCGVRPGRRPGTGPVKPSASGKFHAKALSLGSMGLDPRREALAQLWPA